MSQDIVWTSNMSKHKTHIDTHRHIYIYIYDTYEKSNHHPKSTIILFRSAISKKDIITYHPLSAMAAEALLEGGGLVSTLGYHCTNIGVCVCVNVYAYI